MQEDKCGFYLEDGSGRSVVVVSPRKIGVTLCAESAMVDADGYFYFPEGKADGRQVFRKLTSAYNLEARRRELIVSSEWYYNDGGQFVVGGVDFTETTAS